MTLNLNGYYTVWENKPADSPPSYTLDDETYRVNINGMDALHMGVEVEFAYRILDNLMYEGLLSAGDWTWTSSDSARVYDDNQNLVDVVSFDAQGIYVGDAAQFQTRHSLRWEIIERLYVKSALTYFGKNYSNFDPLDLNPDRNPWAFAEDGTPRQSWRMPNYYLVDFHAGYGFNVNNLRFNIRASVLNLLDEKYISDADNNDKYVGQSFNDFDAKSAAVFFGLGRRYNISLEVNF
jgi:outer membrane receptor for ferrienterochelin and colicin